VLVKGRLADLGHGRAGPAGLLGQPVANMVAQLAGNAGGGTELRQRGRLRISAAVWLPASALGAQRLPEGRETGSSAEDLGGLVGNEAHWRQG
jgi:hypothetical protein